jgi:hypothetical protein
MGLLDDVWDYIQDIRDYVKKIPEMGDKIAVAIYPYLTQMDTNRDGEYKSIMHLLNETIQRLKNVEWGQFEKLIGNQNSIINFINSLDISGNLLADKIREGNLGNMIANEIEFSLKLLNGEYDYMNNPKKEWYSNDYSATALYTLKKKDGTVHTFNISHYETIKIRNIIASKLKVKGYPLATFKGINFDSGVSLWIPSGFDLAFTQTRELWISDNSKIWSSVYIVYTGSARIKAMLALVPFVDLDTAFRIFFNAVPIEIDIWDNMAFYNTAHDNLILANWDKCKQMIENF